MITRKSKVSMMCHLCSIAHHLRGLPLASSQQLPADPLPNNCFEAPCTYEGECRDRSGACGDTALHCNAESIWMPHCGGGAGLSRPQQASASPPTNRPAMRPSPVAPQTLAAYAPMGSSEENNSPRPTTSWELWINEKAQPAGEGGEDAEDAEDAENAEKAENADSWGLGGQDDLEDGTLDEIPLKEGNDGDDAASSNGTGYNKTAWVGFNPDSYGYRGQEESEDGILDQIPFLNNLAMESLRNEIGLLLSVALAWTVLL